MTLRVVRYVDSCIETEEADYLMDDLMSGDTWTNMKTILEESVKLVDAGIGSNNFQAAVKALKEESDGLTAKD